MKHFITVIHYLLFIILCFLNIDLAAQSFDRSTEKSIHADEMPAAALALLNEFWIDQKKADFYREFDDDSMSYEAMFMHHNHLLNIKFN